ncbi:hypothetical protein ACWC10_26635 [Streptomyces sp. NPDC001595]|uniref:hypothetical protein n=1 Tax=Streptomyces sp. NPDC001532 TaxID=3154520 RepID=UPI003322F659
MTAMTAAAAPAAPGPRGPRGLVRAVLRLHRTALWCWLAALAAATAVLVWMVLIADEARRGHGPCATPATGGLPSCAEVEAITADTWYADGMGLISGALAFLALPVAAWAGGALIGRELENGTAHLAWTQSVTPARWLAAKLAVPAALLTAGVLAVLALYRWARGDGDPDLVGDWYLADVFLAGGPTALAHPLAGLALGALTGLLTGRALPAAGLSLAVWAVLYNLLDRFRGNLWPPATATRPLAEEGTLELPRSAFQLDWRDIETGGTEHFRITYHPAAHRLPLQLVESGILLALTAAATGACFLLLRRRSR